MRGQSFAAPNYDSTKQQLTLETQLFEDTLDLKKAFDIKKLSLGSNS